MKRIMIIRKGESAWDLTEGFDDSFEFMCKKGEGDYKAKATYKITLIVEKMGRR